MAERKVEMASPEVQMLRQRFVDGMSRAAWTVTIVTTAGAAGTAGVTVSAMSSVSADTPKPTLLVCINEKSNAAQPVIDNGVFCVNVLATGQAAIADAFAGRAGLSGAEKFRVGTWTLDSLGCPALGGALVTFSCRVTAIEKVGTHFVIFGGIEAVSTAVDDGPLVYAARRYGTFEPSSA